VFANNLLGAFNVVEACVRGGVRRLVNISSETVPGFVFAERPFEPSYCPVDEEHPALPQDPYALAKLFGEQLCDAAVRRSDLTAVSVRPSWVMWEGNYARNVGPYLRDPDLDSITFWSYVDAYDLAELVALAVEASTPGHEVVYAAQPDNMGGRDLAAAVARHHPDVELRPLDRPDAGGIAIGKARRLLGWEPRRSWRDYLGPDGTPRVLPGAGAAGPVWPGPLGS
jgi:nucleoside-diphosphate-sugar epimerase